jgi:NitT/TauT family transport system substrate-binding protein
MRLAAPLVLAVALAAAAPVPAASPAGTISFGVLPVIQALPVFVAAEKGLFAAQGLTVELIPFNSALEKDAALNAGNLQGYFGDLLTPTVLAGNGTSIKTVATIYNTLGQQRMFAILTPPKAAVRTLDALAADGIAGSSNTINEYVFSTVLSRALQRPVTLNLVETKSIPIRLQMLMSGQVGAAILPEPLVTLAESQGAAVVADDRGLGISPTVLSFTGGFLQAEPDKVRRFCRAVAAAVTLINATPEEARPIMVKSGRVPEPLQGKLAVPVFPPLSLPDRKLVEDVAGWLAAKGILKRTLGYGDLVADGFLP